MEMLGHINHKVRFGGVAELNLSYQSENIRFLSDHKKFILPKTDTPIFSRFIAPAPVAGSINRFKYKSINHSKTLMHSGSAKLV